MKRQFTLILTIYTVFILSSCSGMHYEKTDYVINGYDVYQYNHRFSEVSCDRISQFGLFVRDGDIDILTNKDFGECRNTLYIKSSGDYVTLSEGVSEELFTLEEVLEVEWDFEIYETHDLLVYTNVDNLVFRNDSTTVNYDEYYNGNLEDELERLLLISESVYQKFIIDYLPTNRTSIGYIDVYLDDVIVVTLEVYEEGIFDPSTMAFQERNTSELHGLYKAVMNE